MSFPFELKKVYKFSVYPAQILGSDFENVTVLSIMDYESALQLADVAATQATVKSFLPSGVDLAPEDYDWIKVRLASGLTTILAIPWINESTIELVESRKMTVVIDGVGSSDVTRVREALIQNGYNQISITLNS